MFSPQSPIKAAVAVGTKLSPVKVAPLKILLWYISVRSIRRYHIWAFSHIHLVVEVSTRKPGRKDWPRQGS